MFMQAPPSLRICNNTEILCLSFRLHPYLECVRREAQVIICAGLSEPSLLANAISTKILELAQLL